MPKAEAYFFKGSGYGGKIAAANENINILCVSNCCLIHFRYPSGNRIAARNRV